MRDCARTLCLLRFTIEAQTTMIIGRILFIGIMILFHRQMEMGLGKFYHQIKPDSGMFYHHTHIFSPLRDNAPIELLLSLSIAVA